MTEQLFCAGCRRRFGKRAKTVLMFGDFVLCEPCSVSRAAHARVFAGCRQPGCTAINHSGDLCSVGIARQTIAAFQNQSQ
jgi:hypothetical protein